MRVSEQQCQTVEATGKGQGCVERRSRGVLPGSLRVQDVIQLGQHEHFLEGEELGR